MFQEKVWYDQVIMKEWASTEYLQHFTKSVGFCEDFYQLCLRD